MGGDAAASDAPMDVGAEADITADVPSGARQLSVWLRRTRMNKVRKIVREVYLRDDIVPETFEGADQILILDTNVALHQIDFIAEDSCINHVVVPYTVLQEVRNRHMGTYARLRALCRVDVDDKKELEEVEKDLAAEAVPTKQRKGLTVRDMSSSRNARRFYVFPNEFFRETYVDRKPEESQNDRNDRAIRRVAHWYRRHLVGPEVILLTDDRECRTKAKADGLSSLSCWEYVQRSKKQFPEAGEKLAIREEAMEEDPSKPSTEGTATKRKRAPLELGKDDLQRGAVYPAHLKASEVEAGLKDKSVYQGVLRMHANTCLHATVNVHGVDEISMHGRLNINRGVDGDVVAIELLDDEDEAIIEQAAKRSKLSDAELNAAEGKVATVADGLKESALSSGSTGTMGPKKIGRVVGIIKRNWREYAGTLRPIHSDRKDEAEFGKASRVFIPADARIPNVAVNTRQSTNLENKRIVCVIDSWDRFSHQPRGHWTMVLGDVGDRATESAVILHEHGVITREFSEAVLRCLPSADFKPTEEDLKGRMDLRGICATSVDPPGCKDIDDAISCEPLENGNFRVGVHIADVTHFVLPGAPIDMEAAERCTTVYLVEKRTDMLPSLLTTDLCSLVGGVERLCFTVLWEMTPEAVIVNVKYGKAIIKSRRAMSYAEAQAKIDDPNDDSEIAVSLRNSIMLTGKIRKQRTDAGALELASQEVKFELDSETQDPTDVAEYQQRETNKMIEELMLLANGAVAKKILDSFPMFAVLRRHPPPKEDALKILKKLLDKHNIDFKYGSNKELGQSLNASVKEEDPFFNTLVRTMTTRCMNQAVYFCTGEVQPALYAHYGLAMENYTHFTSPIRRYADVLVHRLLMAALGTAPLPEALQSKPVIAEQCEKINLKHRMAQWAGRASSDLHTFLYFNAHGKKEAEAIVTRVRRTGLQVVVPRYGIDGVCPMKEEDWIIDEDNQVVTSRTDEKITMGVFGHIMVTIEADNSDFRNRTYLNYLNVVTDTEQESFAAAEASRKAVAKEMFPDQLVREAN